MSEHDRDIGESIRVLTLDVTAGTLQVTGENRPSSSCLIRKRTVDLIYNFKE